jgi:hypothetical protein
MHLRVYYCFSDFMHLPIIKITRLLFGAIFIISFNSFAQTDITDQESATKSYTGKKTLIDKEESVVTVGAVEFETGAGGNIKPEREYRTKVESQSEWHAHLLWENRYVTEGRDNLSGHSLVSASTEFSIEEFSVIPWIADSAATDYSEFNLNVIYGTRLTQSLIFYVGYNYIYARFSDEKANDNEISLDLAYEWFKHINAFASIYHSFDSNGSFMEMAIEYNDTLSKKLDFSVQGLFGLNAGYIPDGHNGLNHFQLRANVSYHPATQIELYVYTGYNVAINRDAIKYAGDELLRDFSWSGAGFSYLF